MKIDTLRCLLIADSTIDQLATRLASPKDRPSIQCEMAPFDQVHQVLMNPGMDCWKSDPNLAVIWTRPERAVPSFSDVLDLITVPLETLLAEVDQFCDLVLGAAQRLEAVFVPTWVQPVGSRNFGVLGFSSEQGISLKLLQMNVRLAERLADVSNVFVLDAEQWIRSLGPNATNPKFWLMAKQAFAPEVLRMAAADIKAAICGILGLSKKLVIVDLDDTLWGGILGEVGWQGVSLGGHDPFGESFVQFQKALKRLTRMGVILGLVSKNDEAIALDAIRSHPDMVLKPEDFAGWRINWRDKATNIEELVAELNLGLDSVVFIDDSAAERGRVREALPQVLVPDWPEDKLLYCQALEALRVFDRPSITSEDVARTAMYTAERQRNEVRASTQSPEEWLASLELVVTAEPLGEDNIKRAAQLFNKTNQMNLSTRRMTEAELLEWSLQSGQHVYCFRVADRFGDYGLTGIVSVAGNTVADFLISCRVMGRGVERSMLHLAQEIAHRGGSNELVMRYVPTERNKPLADFLRDESSFVQSEPNVWTHSYPYEKPSHIELVLPVREALSSSS